MNEDRETGERRTANISFMGNLETSARLKQNVANEMKPKMENTETDNNIVGDVGCYLDSINSEIEAFSAPA